MIKDYSYLRQLIFKSNNHYEEDRENIFLGDILLVFFSP